MNWQKANPWNAVVAATKDIAVQWIEAFNLSKEMWLPTSHDADLKGARFERIVMIRPHWRQTAEQITAFDVDVVPRWAAHLAPGATLRII